MQIGSRQILVIGDRVLIKADNAEDRTRVGLYLPQTGQERRDSPVRYIPVQAEVGDYALFLRKEAVEIRYQDEQFLVVPQGAILMLIRGDEAG